jgi:hypothetical protein
LPAALLVMIRPHKAQIVLALAFLAPERFAGDAFFPFVWRDIEVGIASGPATRLQNLRIF